MVTNTSHKNGAVYGQMYFLLTMLTSTIHAAISGSPGYQGPKGEFGYPGVKGRTGPRGLPGKVLTSGKTILEERFLISAFFFHVSLHQVTQVHKEQLVIQGLKVIRASMGSQDHQDKKEKLVRGFLR